MRRREPEESGMSPLFRDPWVMREREWLESVGADAYTASEVRTRSMKPLNRILMMWGPFEPWAARNSRGWIIHELRQDARGLVWARRVFPMGKRAPPGAPVTVGPFKSAQDASRYIRSIGRLNGLHLYGPPVDVGGWEPAPYKPLTDDQLPPT